MKKSYNILYWIFAFLPLVISLSVFPLLPERIALHYNFQGQADRWGSPAEMLILPVFCIVLGVLFYLGTGYANKKNAQNGKVMALIGIGMLLVMSVLTGLMLYQSFQSAGQSDALLQVDTMRVLGIVFGIFFILLGNLLPKCKQNSVVGIRVKWTLENEEVWYQTHRVGGRLMVIGGFICLVLCALWLQGIAALLTALGVILVELVFVCIFARNLYVKLKK